VFAKTEATPNVRLIGASPVALDPTRSFAREQ